MSHQNFLFNEFQQASSKEWKQKIQVDLKGADYNEVLVWESLEGIKIKPFYHSEDFERLDIPMKKGDFLVCQTVYIDSPEIANKIALDALNKGANAIQFIAEKSFDLDVLFQNFDKLENTPKLFIKNKFLSYHFNKELLDYFEDDRLILQQDIIGNLASNGNWNDNEEADFDILSKSFKSHPSKISIGVDAGLYQNAGANIVQQVAYALAHANVYIEKFGKDVVNAIQFEFATGSHYFFEIAKLRAFRYLWAKLTKTHGNFAYANIMSKSSLRNKTLYDYNVNLLRTTTENMSAVLGSANVVTSLAYDVFFKKSNEFSQRIARNQLILLKEENGFKEAQYFANGSYYIESLTIAIAKKALQLLQKIEKKSDFLSELKQGTIQKNISEAALKEQKLFDKGELILLGTNKFPNENDKMSEAIELYPFIKKDKRQTIIEPILTRRLAEKLEQERIASE